MTDYCTAANVQKWFPGVTLSTSTKITLAQVEEMITGHSATIDSRLAAVYSTPITGTVSLLIVKRICEYLTIADVEGVLLTGLGSRGENVKPTDYRQLAMDEIDRIESGELILTDATTNRSNDFYNDNNENDREFVMKKGSVQW